MNFNRQYKPSGFGYLPVVTKNIIIINVIMFVATTLLQAKDIDLTRYFGLHYHLAPDFKPHQFITYIFMHGSFTHLLFNMLAVYIFGQALEQLWGPRRYIIFYIVTGLGAAIAQYIILWYGISHTIEAYNLAIDVATDTVERSYYMNEKFNYINYEVNRQVVVGASGSLFGLLGAFGMLFPNTELLIYFLFPIKAKWLVIFYGAFELISGLRNDPMDNVAHFAHIGGLIVGVILVLVWRKNTKHFY